jgi:hypothetical protein
MQVIKITGYMPTTVKNKKDAAAIDLAGLVKEMASSNGGELTKFSVHEGTAMIFIVGDAARQAIMKAFEDFKEVKIEEIPAIRVLFEQNQTRQKKADRLRKAREKAVTAVG